MSNKYWRVPRDWDGAACVIMASGPSFTRHDAAAISGLGARVRSIAVSDQFRLAPWADLLYSCDARWWDYHWPRGASEFAGLKVALDPDVTQPGVRLLENTGEAGFDPAPHALRTGMNSGYQAVHLAVHLGVSTIVLVGFDMQPGEDGRTHNFGSHPPGLAVAAPYEEFAAHFDGLKEPLAARGIEVVNASPRSKVTTWPHVPLTDALRGLASMRRAS